MKFFLTLALICLIPAITFAQKSRKFVQKSRKFSLISNYTRSAGITLSLPWANGYAHYNYETGRPTSKWGFVGLGLSFYYKKDKQKWSLNMGITADAPAPIGPIDYGKEGTRWTIGARFVEANFHYAIYKRVGVIGGVNFVNYRYWFIDYDNDYDFTRRNSTLGLTAGVEYLSKRSFALAVFYRPALTSFQQKQYFHMISLDMRFDLPVWKR